MKRVQRGQDDALLYSVFPSGFLDALAEQDSKGSMHGFGGPARRISHRRDEANRRRRRCWLGY